MVPLIPALRQQSSRHSLSRHSLSHRALCWTGTGRFAIGPFFMGVLRLFRCVLRASPFEFALLGAKRCGGHTMLMRKVPEQIVIPVLRRRGAFLASRSCVRSQDGWVVLLRCLCVWVRLQLPQEEVERFYGAETCTLARSGVKCQLHLSLSS